MKTIKGNGYVIAEELSTGVETSSYKFEVFTEKGTVVQVNYSLYNNVSAKNGDKIYSTYYLDVVLEDNGVELTDEERKLLQDCKMLLENHTVDFIQFEELQKWT